MGEWMYRSTFSLTSALVLSGQLHAPVALPSGKSPRYPFYRRLGEPQSRSGWYGEVKIVYPTGTRTPDPSVFQPVTSRYTDWAIPAPQLWGTASNSNIEILQRFQSKTLRSILNAPWCINNHRIRENLRIKAVLSEIKMWNTKHLR
jgi:hypothetical protein